MFAMTLVKPTEAENQKKKKCSNLFNYQALQIMCSELTLSL